jgi:hypothetical protein
VTRPWPFAVSWGAAALAAVATKAASVDPARTAKVRRVRRRAFTRALLGGVSLSETSA